MCTNTEKCFPSQEIRTRHMHTHTNNKPMVVSVPVILETVLKFDFLAYREKHL